ncbi:MAG: glycosyltransferase family 4 protein [Rhodospirillales bacterium]|nr:glycosyltransferase family 4 protein [Rhodospirillales bacterium]
MLTIYINGRFLAQKMTGQQRFSRELVCAIDRWLENGHASRLDCRFVILAPPGSHPLEDLQHIETKIVGSFDGHLWDQIDLARHAFGGVLLSLCGTGPLLHPRHVVTLHDAAPFANPENFTRKFRLAYSVLVPLLAKAARRVVTVSEFSKRELSHYCRIRPEKIDVVPNGADHILRTPAETSVLAEYGLENRRFVLAVGSISANKNFGAVVEAFNRLNRSDLTLAVAGGQNSSVFSRYEIKDTANLVRLGYISDAALRALYEHALCFVLPSLYEGFGIPPVEAMQCGCPVVVSTAPALIETCGDGALFCDPHRPDELAEKIAQFADDAELRERMRARGRARGGRFTWERSGERLMRILLELAQKGEEKAFEPVS